MSLLHEAKPCPFGLEPLDCPHGAHVLDLNRVSGWTYKCQRLKAPCPAYKQSATRDELFRRIFGSLRKRA